MREMPRSATTEMMRARDTWGRFMTWPDFKEAWANRAIEEPEQQPFGLLDVPMKLRYYYPPTGVIGAGPVKFEEEWYDDWLDAMVKTDEDVIFFLTTDSTDVFEQEFDFNTVVSMGDNQVISHTYSPWCPAGCHGQLDDCAYKGPDH